MNVDLAGQKQSVPFPTNLRRPSVVYSESHSSPRLLPLPSRRDQALRFGKCQREMPPMPCRSLPYQNPLHHRNEPPCRLRIDLEMAVVLSHLMASAELA